MRARTRVAVAAAAIAAAATFVAAQAPSAPAVQSARAFDVASVKPNLTSRACLFDVAAPVGRARIVGCPVGRMIQISFELTRNQLVGVPDWDRNSSFDILTTYDPQAAPTRHDQLLLVQQLLADRFGLVMHREQRQMPVYALTLARKDGRLGKYLQRSDIDCEAWKREGSWPYDEGVPSPYTPFHERPACGIRPGATPQGTRYLVGGTQTMAELITRLQSFNVGDGRPIVDRTGLTGAFDYDLEWSQAQMNTDATDLNSNSLASIFTAIQEQLGLKLESTTAPQEVVVVDRVAQPTPD